MTEHGFPTPEDVEAYQTLGLVLDHLPRTRHGQVNAGWTRYRNDSIETHGQNSIAALIPGGLNFDSRGVINLLNTLLRNRIVTMEDLVKINPDTFIPNDPLTHRVSLGPKSTILTKALKAVAEVELRRKSSIAS